MALHLRDEGDTSIFLADDGVTELRVAKEAAQPYMPTPNPAADAVPVAPVPDLGPAPLDVAPPEALPAPIVPIQPTIQPAPAPEVAAPGPVPPSPIAAEPVAEAFAAPAPVAAPNVLPTGPLDKPTQIASAVNEASQDKAESAARVGNAQVSAADTIIAGSHALDASMQKHEDARAAEEKERRADEERLTGSYTKMVDRYAKFKVDPTRGMSSGRQALGWIAAAISGLGSALKGQGEKNPGLDALMAGLDRNVQLQMAERDALGTSIGLKKEALADFRGATKTRLGEYDLRMAGELRKYASLVERVKVRLGSVEEREAATQLISTLEAEAVTRTGSAVSQETQQRAAARAARAAAQKAQQAAEEKRQQWAFEHGATLDPNTGIYVLNPRSTQAVEAEGHVLDNRKKAKDLLSGPADTEGSIARVKDTAARSVNGFDGKPLMRTVIQKDANGKDVKVAVPVMAKSEKEGQELRAAQEATANVTRASQLLRVAIANNGGSAAVLGSPEYQQAKALIASIDLDNKEIAKLGVIAGPDMGFIEGMRGGVDPTSFIKDAGPGLEAMEKRIEEKYNAKLRAVTDYADSADGATPQAAPKAAPAAAGEKQPVQRVRSITTADPSLGDDKGAIAADAEQKLADLDVFLARDKPSAESIEAVMHQVSAARMPATTKAAILARLNEARDKLTSPEAAAVRQVREFDRLGRGAPDGRVIPEEVLYGLPPKKATK
jgi:hypothetical protein